MSRHARKLAWLPANGAVLFWALTVSAELPPGEQPGDLRVELSAKSPSVRFGDELTIVATLSNQGKDSVTIPPGALLLAPSGWSATGTGGTGLGPYIGVPGGDESLTVPPGEKRTVTFGERERTVVALGKMSARWRVVTDNAALRPLLGRQGRLRVEYEVRPSRLMEAAWAARTDEDRARLIPEVRNLLLRRSQPTDYRQRRFIERTFEYLAASALPLLDALAKDPDPVVRAQAIEQYPHSAWAAGNMEHRIEAARRGAESIRG